MRRAARLIDAGMKHAIGLMGSPARVTRADDGVTIEGVNLAIGSNTAGAARRMADLTPGQPESTKGCKVLRAEWDRLVGRPPMRGDVIEVLGRRYGVLGTTPEGVADQNILYVLDVKG